MEKVALVFPGQGSQFIGMGSDFYRAFPAAKELYLKANDLLGFDVKDITFFGPEEKLDDTFYTQPAILVTSLVIFEVLKQKTGKDIIPACFAGHSLGEYSALVASGAIDFEAGLGLVRERARLMKWAGEKSGGGMIAVIGAEPKALEAAVQRISHDTGSVLVVANDNCPGQVVVSGGEVALEHFSKVYKEAGAKFVKRLPVSVACHSPLMEPAQLEFDQKIDQVRIQTPKSPVYGNTTGLPLNSAEEIGAELKTQLSKSVLWTDSVKNMIRAGVKTFVEIGPGRTLNGLIKRIDPNAVVVNVNTVEELEQLPIQ